MPNFRINNRDIAETNKLLQESASAIADLRQPLNQATRESDKHRQAIEKQNYAQKTASSSINSLEKSLFSLATGSRNASQSVAAFGQSFLRGLLKQTLKTSITNPLKQLFAVAHSGGIIGEARRAIYANSALPRFHSGGIAGLRPDEVPLIAKRGEEILTQNDPRHRANATQPITVQVTVNSTESDASNSHEQNNAIALAVRQGALAAIQQQAARGGNFARSVGRR